MKTFHFALMAFCLLVSQANLDAQENQKNIMYNKAKTIQAPNPERQVYEHKEHGNVRKDNYHWMRLTDAQKNAEQPDSHTQKVVDYLNEENSYTANIMSHLNGFEEELFAEIKSRIKETDMSVPYLDNGYYYTSKYEEGKEYPIYTRQRGSLDAAEEELLNVNDLAADYDYYSAAGLNVSPNNKILAYGEDIVSRRIYTIRFKNLETNEMLTDFIPNTTGGIVWANDNKTVFYTIKDASLRSFKIMKHTLGTDAKDDVEVYHETDETFGCFVRKSKSNKYIIIGSFSTLAQEYRYLNADKPSDDFILFQPRERNLEYSIAHFGDHWYIRTNKDGAKNFKLMTTPLTKTSKDNWTDKIAHRKDVLLESMTLFSNYLVLTERIEGINKLRVIPQDAESYYIDFGEDASMSYASVNRDFNTDILRLGYTSMTTPNSTYDFNMKTKEKTLLKQQEVLGDFEAGDYRSERIKAKVRDGVEVPMSIVYHKDTKIDGTAPCLLYGYGSYGNSMDPYFSSVRLSLLNRGFVYVIAHIRGGEEMGRHWYEDGKLLNKKNTFNDFIDCGKYLKEKGYSADDQLFGMGGSAGGLLMGVIINEAPDLWKGIVSQVPFVDVISTMLDETIPLTTGEFDEWGNPKDKTYYDYMLSYSPYDNIKAMNYPAMLVTTGYFDSQVQYWEPAKWVAKLREMKTDQNPLIFKTNMSAGHGGASGRFKRLREVATEYAFILDLANRAK